MKLGDLVTLQDPQTKLREEQGIVTEIREYKLSYFVQVGNRLLFIRSRKILKRGNKGHGNERVVVIKEEDSSILQSLPTATSAHIYSNYNPTLNSNQPRWDLGSASQSPKSRKAR